WSVFGVELVLIWTSVTGVYTVNSTGQLIPLVGGLGAILFGLHRALDKSWNRIFKPAQSKGVEKSSLSRSRVGSNNGERGEELEMHGEEFEMHCANPAITNDNKK